MDRFQYEILTGREDSTVPGGVFWFFASDMTRLGHNLPSILNQLGGQGWEVAGIGDVGFTGRSEIIIKKRIE